MRAKEYKQLKEKAAALKTVVDDFERQKAELEIRLNTAMGHYLEAARKVKQFEPLTPTMRSALETLVKYGKNITESDIFGTSYWIEMRPDSGLENLTIRKNVFFGLLFREALQPRKYAGGRYIYEVSEHGKTLVDSKGKQLRLEVTK